MPKDDEAMQFGRRGTHKSSESVPSASASGSIAATSRNFTGRSLRSKARLNKLQEPPLPAEFAGSHTVESFLFEDVPSADALSRVLNERGLDTSSWGSGNTKDVSKLWKEIKEEEAALEVWRKPSGELVTMRVTHVLRGKVSSEENYHRGIFLFNAWQQYGDGRKRTRNGLLSEKLTTAEIPLEEHLHEVCQRAVTEEEMARVVDAAVRVQPDEPIVFDPDYRCPLEVIGEDYVEHTVEIEISKSYPGLMTVYHLYTVDILVKGLPITDFNTLEFDHVDKDGKRPLKYVHAWVWEQWGTIQRHLLQGSELKERKRKGDFKNPRELEDWLTQFDIDLESWGKGKWKSAGALFQEVEREETELEHWARTDGVPLLMRVVHVIQLKVTSSDLRQSRKFLFQVWQQSKEGFLRHVNRFMARKLSTSQLPFDLARFTKAAKQAVQDQLSHLVDIHIRLSPNQLPDRIYGEHPEVIVKNVEFSDHRNDLEDSPSFKDMVTMYHLYTVEVECEGLPVSDFASIVHQPNNNMTAFGWKWVTWQQTLDILHTRSKMMEHRDRDEREKLLEKIHNCNAALAKLTSAVQRLKAEFGPDNAQVLRVSQAAQRLEAQLLGSQAEESRGFAESRIAMLPPTMISKLADGKLVSDRFLDEAMRAAQRRLSRTDEVPSPRKDRFLSKDNVEDPNVARAKTEEAPQMGCGTIYGCVFSGCMRRPKDGSLESEMFG
jgi:hypothetical protein